MKLLAAFFVSIASFWAGYGLYDPMKRNQPPGFAVEATRKMTVLEQGLNRYFDENGHFPVSLQEFAEESPNWNSLINDTWSTTVSGERLEDGSFRLYSSFPPFIFDEAEGTTYSKIRRTVELKLHRN